MNSPTSEHFSPVLRDDLLTRWSEPHRRYHTVDHLIAVLTALDTLADADVQFDHHAVQLAAWFHDAIYDIAAPDNEERSAALALDKLSDSAVAEEVASLVRVTADHRPGVDDRNAAALCDADLAVLAGTESEYAAYASRVRAEYSSVPDDVFNAGRADLLERMLKSETLFHTTFGREHWEQRARENVTAEIASLRAT